MLYIILLLLLINSTSLLLLLHFDIDDVPIAYHISLPLRHQLFVLSHAIDVPLYFNEVIVSHYICVVK